MLVSSWFIAVFILISSPIKNIAEENVNAEDVNEESQQRFLTLKELPSAFKKGFGALRGKKDYEFPDFAEKYVLKRPFSAMRGKKNDIEDTKRGFGALRGKKFTALRGKKDFNYGLFNELLNRKLDKHLRQKRRVQDRRSFTALRGKKSGLSSFIDIRLRDSLLQALQQAIIYGVKPNYSKTTMAAKRPSFVPLRGRKSENSPTEKMRYSFEEWLSDEDDQDNVEDLDSLGGEDDGIRDFVFKRDAPTNRPIGFISMRGKRSLE